MKDYEHKHENKFPYGEVEAKLTFKNGKSIDVCVTEYEEKMTKTNYTGVNEDGLLYRETIINTMKIWKVMQWDFEKTK